MRTVELTPEQRQELERLRDTASKPYLRERAAAILKVADGASGRAVALHGLLRPHRPDTVYDWLDRFQEHGVAGLSIQPGRGRKPAFSPSLPGGGSRPGGVSPFAPPGSQAVRRGPRALDAGGSAGAL